MVLEDSKEAIEADIHARWLDHSLAKGLNFYPSSGDFCGDIAITK